jgi:ATP-dependent exoDNAse (exonuclease V) alpha subunit
MLIHLELNALTYVVNVGDIEQVPPLLRRYDQLVHLEEQRSEELRKMSQRK